MGGARQVPRGATVACALVLAAGCGHGGGAADAPVRNAHTVAGQVSSLARTVMPMMNVTGKTTAGAPPAGTPLDTSCGGDDDSPVRQRLQTWSLYGVDNGTLGTAMANLVANLPEHDWKVTRNGPNSSSDRDQEVQAVHGTTKTRLDVTWQRQTAQGTPLVLFYVSSGCFRDSAAADAG